ncbi:MAG: hypothetical protein SFV54_13470 [Bryobacteraceae bacterium]|nr:hypothetical protein [Bryobacteraceae bacterium]
MKQVGPGDAIRILVADDNEPAREGLVLLINAQPDMVVTASVGTFAAVLAELEQHPVDVVVMDRGLAAAAVRETLPAPCIVFLTACEPDHALALAQVAGHARLAREELRTGLARTIRGLVRRSRGTA